VPSIAALTAAGALKTDAYEQSTIRLYSKLRTVLETAWSVRRTLTALGALAVFKKSSCFLNGFFSKVSSAEANQPTLICANNPQFVDMDDRVHGKIPEYHRSMSKFAPHCKKRSKSDRYK
jgi:hypothetical protein